MNKTMNKIIKKTFTWTNLKWLMLFMTITMTALIVLLYYRGEWGAGAKATVSTYHWDSTLHKNVADVTLTGEGGAVFRQKQLILSFLGGGALAFAGCLLQKVTRNNLAEVSILGIGSINIMFIFAYVFLFKKQVFGNGIVAMMLPLVTLTASILGTTFVWAVSRSKKANKNTFVIVGIAVQLLFEALSVVFVNPTKLSGKEGKEIWHTVKNYTMGQVRQGGDGAIPYWLIITAAIIIGVVIVAALLIRKKIDIYETNEHMATALGIKVGRLRFTIFFLVALLAGAEATILGTVALLGIIAPSIARLMFKNKFGPMSIASFLIGGVLVSLASFISISVGTLLPPGILATAIASPYFIFLILRGK